MDVDKLSPAFLENIFSQLVKSKIVEVKFFLKPEIAKEVISFVEKIEDERREK